MRILSLNIGSIGALDHGGRSVPSAIGKVPTNGPVQLGFLGLDGDHQADRKNHGGPDKAVCVFAHEHYDKFSRQLGKALPPASFGENLTTIGLLESEVCIGDVYRIGEAAVQVSQPRQPCFKLGARHGQPLLPDWVRDSRLTGFYFRVLQPGVVEVGQTIEVVSKGSISVAEANELMYAEVDREGIERLLEDPALSASWQRSLRTRLAREE